MQIQVDKKSLNLYLIFADLYDYDIAKSNIKTIIELDALYRDFRYSPVNENCPIYIIHNSIRYKNNKKEDKTFIHKIIKGKPGVANEVLDIAVFNIPSAIQKQDYLMTIFRFIDKIEKPEHVFLTTWDHGSVFGIFKARRPDFEHYVSIRSNNKVLGLNDLLHGDFESIDFIPDPPPIMDIALNEEVEILTNEELAFAIKKGFERQKVDVLLMMNCNLMNVHTIGAFNNVVDYLVSPATDIDEPGYNYCSIINEINSPTETKATDLAMRCVTSIFEKSLCASPKCQLYRDGFAQKKVYDSWKIFAVEMHPPLIDSLIFIINSFSQGILNKITDKRSEEAQSFMNCVGQARNSINLLTVQGLHYHLYDFSAWSDSMYDICSKRFPKLFELIKEELLYLKTSLKFLRDSFVLAETNSNTIHLSPFCIFLPIKKVSQKIGDSPYITSKGKEDDLFKTWLQLLDFFFH